MSIRYFSILLVLIIVSCKESTTTPAPKKEIVIKEPFEVEFSKVSKKYKKEKQAEISNFYNETIKKNKFSGGFLVAKNGEILFENYNGFANYKTKKEVTATTPLHLASVSKVLTAAVVMRLYDEKKLDINQNIKTYFPNFPHDGVTIKTLLNHRSGIPNYAYFTEPDNIWGRKKILHNEDIIDLLCTKNIPMEYRPDTRFSYCNTNYVLLALIIEKVTKLPYPEAMKQLLFEPLKMQNTFVFEYEQQKDTVSLSYKSNWHAIPFDQFDAVYGDKNIYSTPQDLLKFDLASYSENFFSKKLKEEIFKGYSYERPGVKNYGLGIRLNEWDNYNTLCYHNGWWHGSTTSYITLKKDTVTMIALSNNYNKKVYQLKKLSSVFGEYPFEIEND